MCQKLWAGFQRRVKPHELSFQTLSALKNPPLYILKNPEQAATGSRPAPAPCMPTGLIHSWSPLWMSFLLTSFPISGHFKTSHSHAQPSSMEWLENASLIALAMQSNGIRRQMTGLEVGRPSSKLGAPCTTAGLQ